MSSVKEVLIAARAVISNRENWTKHANARTREGTPCRARSADAYSFCAVGSVAKIKGASVFCSVTAALDDAALTLFSRSIIGLNDTGTHEQVLAVFDRAIEQAGPLSGFTGAK